MLPLIVGVLPTLICGCSDKPEGPQVYPLEGKIEKVELANDNSGKITVSYYSEKQKQDVSGSANLTKDTEVMVNGAAGTLRDLRVGEKIRGEVKVEKKQGERVQTALKIRIDRPKPEAPSGG